MTPTALQRIKEIEEKMKTISMKMGINHDLEFLLKAFNVMRAIALNRSYDAQDADSVQTMIHKEFEEQMDRK